jgi:hypothetical protein
MASTIYDGCHQWSRNSDYTSRESEFTSSFKWGLSWTCHPITLYTVEILCCDVSCDCRVIIMFGLSLLFCRKFMFYLCYLYLFMYPGVQHDFHFFPSIVPHICINCGCIISAFDPFLKSPLSDTQSQKMNMKKFQNHFRARKPKG